jgi:hypothetical protein
MNNKRLATIFTLLIIQSLFEPSVSQGYGRGRGRGRGRGHHHHHHDDYRGGGGGVLGGLGLFKSLYYYKIALMLK